MARAIRLKRPQRGWKCSICGALVSTRNTAEEHCERKLNTCNNCDYYIYQSDNRDEDGFCKHFEENVLISKRCKFHKLKKRELND